jgi:hypothetical protein
MEVGGEPVAVDGRPVAEPPQPDALDTVASALSSGAAARSRRQRAYGKRFEEVKWPLAVYVGTRTALVLVAVVCNALYAGSRVMVGPLNSGHPLSVPESLTQELANWDGWWYIQIASHGYGTHVSHLQTTLGFFPLYSMVIWAIAHVLFCSNLVAGLVVSGIGGFVATVLVQRLTTQWWGSEVARKAVLLFCLFPGSVVFSMVYPEGLLIALVAGSMLALSHKRWLLSGLLAGLATGIGPDSLVVVPMCLAASVVELRQRGWRDPIAWRSLLAPALAPAGAVAFAAFLWAWTGTPFANYIAQKYGWHEKTTPFAIPTQVLDLMHEVDLNFHWWFIRFFSSGKAGLDLNRVVALVGTAFLVTGAVWLWRERKTVPVDVLVFSGFMAILMVTSLHVPPNPRLLLTGFPLVLVFAKRLRGQAWKWTVALSAASLLLLSGLTYVGNTLRP